MGTDRRRRVVHRAAALGLGLVGCGALALCVERALETGAPTSRLLDRGYDVRAAWRVGPDFCLQASRRTRRPWRDAPRVGLAHVDPGRLAAASLAWFERSPAAEEWRGGRAVLELEYQSAGRFVTVRSRPGGASWGARLSTWLERFPPDRAATAVPEPDVGWTLELGDGASVAGLAATAHDAVTALEDLARLAFVADDPEATFGLCSAETIGANTVDHHGVRTRDPREIAELPRRAAERALARRGG